MERTLTPEATVPSAILPGRVGLFERLVPLWRHALFVAAVAAVFGVGAWIRLDVQQLRKDMDRSSRAILEARVLHDRLGLETQARRRAIAMEAAAAELGLGPTSKVEVLALTAVRE